MHSCSSIKIVCLFRLTCDGSQALTWSWSSSWPSWIGTSWKDVTGLQEGQMPSQLVPLTVKAVGVQSTLKTLPLNFNLAIFVIHSHVFIHHDQSLPWVAQSFQGHSLASCYGQYNLDVKQALSLPMACLNSDHSFYVICSSWAGFRQGYINRR